MSESNFSSPNQFENTEIKIDGQDVRGLFLSVSIFEDIYRPCITGSITINDSDGAGFIEEQGIEFIEPITLKFKNADGEMLEFEGVLNGLRNETIIGPTKKYVIDFSSEVVRKNEQTYVVNSFKETAPEEIIKEMVKKLGGQLDTSARGKKMNYIGTRRRPVDVIQYVCTHALTQETQATENENSEKEDAKGTTGFLCWETLKGFKFESVKDVLKGKSAEEHTDFKTKLANVSLSLQDTMKSIVQVQFDQIGDFQTKLRSGAFSSRLISFDPDTGIYKEYDYYNRENMTEKQMKALPEKTITRYFSKLNTNQRFENECATAQPLTGEQSRGYLPQNSGMQNAFSDQTGQITLYPHFEFSAGDIIDIQVSKVKDEERAQGGYDKRHSGKYVCMAVSHHFFNDGSAYTKVRTIRSTKEQDEASAQKS